VKSAWLNLRRSRYFIGPYNQTPDITIVGEPPYSVLSEGSAPHQLGGAIRLALEASMDEAVSWDDALELADKRTLELARLAGVKDRRTYERGARLVNFDCVDRGEILITPSFRKRGYWDPVPKEQWRRIRRPSDAELGVAAVEAVAASTA
jgi:hypothetical protein